MCLFAGNNVNKSRKRRKKMRSMEFSLYCRVKCCNAHLKQLNVYDVLLHILSFRSTKVHVNQSKHSQFSLLNMLRVVKAKNAKRTKLHRSGYFGTLGQLVFVYVDIIFDIPFDSWSNSENYFQPYVSGFYLLTCAYLLSVIVIFNDDRLKW